MIRIVLHVVAMAGMIAVVVVLSLMTATAQIISPEPDATSNTPLVPHEITAEWLLFGDPIAIKEGPIRDAISDLLKRVQFVDAQQQAIRKEVARVGPLEELVQRLQRTLWSLFYCTLGLLAIAFVLLAGLIFLKDYALRKLFTAGCLFFVCDLALAQEHVAAPEFPSPNLVVYTSENCVHCERWKQEVLPRLVPKGWHVLITQGSQAPFPSFRVRIGDRWVRHDGFLSIDRLRQMVEAR
jgi:hypothetical protein